MGPTNVALVKLFRADQELREAQENYDSALVVLLAVTGASLPRTRAACASSWFAW